jgi:hypothetical protein
MQQKGTGQGRIAKISEHLLWVVQSPGKEFWTAVAVQFEL